MKHSAAQAAVMLLGGVDLTLGAQSAVHMLAAVTSRETHIQSALCRHTAALVHENTLLFGVPWLLPSGSGG